MASSGDTALEWAALFDGMAGAQHDQMRGSPGAHPATDPPRSAYRQTLGREQRHRTNAMLGPAAEINECIVTPVKVDRGH
jgi:hypothetical protein